MELVGHVQFVEYQIMEHNAAVQQDSLAIHYLLALALPDDVMNIMDQIVHSVIVLDIVQAPAILLLIANVGSFVFQDFVVSNVVQLFHVHL